MPFHRLFTHTACLLIIDLIQDKIVERKNFFEEGQAEHKVDGKPPHHSELIILQKMCQKFRQLQAEQRA